MVISSPNPDVQLNSSDNGEMTNAIKRYKELTSSLSSSDKSNPTIVAKNYRVLCSMLGLRVLGGKSKILQLQKLNNYYVRIEQVKGTTKYKVLGLVDNPSASNQRQSHNNSQSRNSKSSGVDATQKILTNCYNIILLLLKCFGNKEWASDFPEILGKTQSKICEMKNETELTSLELNYPDFSLLLGLTNESYRHELLKVSGNTRAIKTDFFYNCEKIIKNIMKKIREEGDKEETHGSNIIPRLSFTYKYKLIKDNIIKYDNGSGGETILLTSETKRLLTQIEIEDAKRREKDIYHNLVQKYSQTEGLSPQDIEQAVSDEYTSLQDKGAFLPRKLSHIYNIEHIEIDADPAQRKTIEKLKALASHYVGANSKEHARYSGSVKTYNKKLEELLVKELGYTSVGVVLKFSVPTSVLQDLIPGTIAISLDKQLKVLYNLILSNNKLVISDLLGPFFDHRALEVAQGVKIDKRNGARRPNELISKMAEEVQTSIKQTGTYHDIISAIIYKYIHLTLNDIKLCVGSKLHIF